MMCHTLQPLFDYTARQFVNSSIVSFCGGVTALIKWALDINRNSNLPVLVGAPLFSANISGIHVMSILLKLHFSVDRVGISVTQSFEALKQDITMMFWRYHILDRIMPGSCKTGNFKYQFQKSSLQSQFTEGKREGFKIVRSADPSSPGRSVNY